MDLLPLPQPPKRKRSARRNKFCGRYCGWEMDRPLPPPNLENRDFGKASASKNTSTPPIDSCRFLASTIPGQQELGPPPRRSPRMSKFSGLYGYVPHPVPRIDPAKTMSYLLPSKTTGSINYEKMMVRLRTLPKFCPNSGFSAECIAEYERKRNPPQSVPDELLVSEPTSVPILNEVMAAGPSKEAMELAIANYGDNLTKVKEFANGFTRLRWMGFPSNFVEEALLMYDNDTRKANAHLLNTKHWIKTSL